MMHGVAGSADVEFDEIIRALDERTVEDSSHLSKRCAATLVARAVKATLVLQERSPTDWRDRLRGFLYQLEKGGSVSSGL